MITIHCMLCYHENVLPEGFIGTANKLTFICVDIQTATEAVRDFIESARLHDSVREVFIGESEYSMFRISKEK